MHLYQSLQLPIPRKSQALEAAGHRKSQLLTFDHRLKQRGALVAKSPEAEGAEGPGQRLVPKAKFPQKPFGPRSNAFNWDHGGHLGAMIWVSICLNWILDPSTGIIETIQLGKIAGSQTCPKPPHGYSTEQSFIFSFQMFTCNLYPSSEYLQNEYMLCGCLNILAGAHSNF